MEHRCQHKVLKCPGGCGALLDIDNYEEHYEKCILKVPDQCAKCGGQLKDGQTTATHDCIGYLRGVNEQLKEIIEDYKDIERLQQEELDFYKTKDTNHASMTITLKKQMTSVFDDERDTYAKEYDKIKEELEEMKRKHEETLKKLKEVQKENDRYKDASVLGNI